MSSVSQLVANTLFGSPGDQDPEGASGDGSPPYQPLPRQSTAEGNRELFQDSRRRVAAATLARAYCLACSMLVIVLALTLYRVLVYAWGFVVYFTEKDKPCDQPLSGWLIVTLVVFPVRLLLDLLRRGLLWALGEESVARWIGAVSTAWHVLGNPVLLWFGFWWLLHCKTCQTTNPALHRFVQLFYVYQVVLWTGTFFVLFALTSLLLWMHRRGLLSSGPGLHAAAGPGVINKIETVAFSPDLFSSAEPEEDKQPAECCVCQSSFDAAQPIKRTPCGHFFHEECLGTWLGNFAKSCPLCRTNLEEAIEEAAIEQAAV